MDEEEEGEEEGCNEEETKIDFDDDAEGDEEGRGLKLGEVDSKASSIFLFLEGISRFSVQPIFNETVSLIILRMSLTMVSIFSLLFS